MTSGFFGRISRKAFFLVDVSQYCPDRHFKVVRPASLAEPTDHAVMFFNEEYTNRADLLLSVHECLVFWPERIELAGEIAERHAIAKVANPHIAYCSFFRDNNITHLPKKESFHLVDGAWIAESACIDSGATILPGAYIGGECVIGKGVYIGSGAKLVGEVYVGNNVVIRENASIGVDSLSTDRDEDGRAITMPQFGYVLIEDDAQIGANTVIGRGAIDGTIIRRGAKIDNNCTISHNVLIGEDTFVVGETIFFGSSSAGNRNLISGNSTICNRVHVGDCSLVGAGSVLTRSVEEGVFVLGNPARKMG